MTSDSASTLPQRNVARVLLLTRHHQLLLVRYPEDLAPSPRRPAFWVAPGGALRPGESYREAAVREVLEETGITLPHVGEHVWTRDLQLLAGGVLVQQHEEVFVTLLPEARAVSFGDANEGITDVRWWPVDSLLASTEVFFPAGLPMLAKALADGVVPATPIALVD